MWTFAITAGRFLVKNKKYWWVLLIFAIVVQAKQNNSLKEKLLEYEGGSLELKEGELAKVRLSGSGVESAVRDGEGGVKRKKKFRAPEADARVDVFEDPKVKAMLADLDDKIRDMESSEGADQDAIDQLRAQRDALRKNLVKVKIKVQRAGLVFRPGIGFLYGGDLYPEIDAKLFFFDRYSLKVGLGFDTGFTPALASAGITRHVDDLLPAPFNFRNVEVQIGAGFRFTEQDFLALLGLRINL